MPFATTQKDLEIIIPSEVNQRKTNITYTSYMWNLKKKNGTNELNLQNRHRLTATENKCTTTRGGRDKLEVWD